MSKRKSDEGVRCSHCGGSTRYILPITLGNIALIALQISTLVMGFGALILYVTNDIAYFAGLLLLSSVSIARPLYRTRLICKECAAPVYDVISMWTLGSGSFKRIPRLRRVNTHVKQPALKAWLPDATWKKLCISCHQFMAASFEDNNEARSVRHLKQLDVLGGEKGALELGYRYLNGKGVHKDHAQAYQCFEKTADQNGKWCMEAEFQLGCMHMLGQFVPTHDAKAGEYFEKAAQKGHSLAQYNWGLALIDGWAGYEDHLQGVEWVEKAAAAGVAEAQETLARLNEPKH